jgi:predicted metal-dependent hydrolase
MKRIKYENKTIAYTVSKARVKNLYISVENGEVVIKAPWYVTNSQIQEVVESKREWIMRKLEEYQKSPRKAKEYADGEQFQVLGKPYTLNIYFKEISKAKLNVTDGSIDIVLPLEYSETDNTAIIKRMIEKMYFMIAEREVDIAMEKLTRKVGLAPEEYRIRKVKTAWGTCSSTKKITINQDLMMYSREAIEYVVLHEICHLKYMNHSKKFWDMVESYMPDYKIYEKELKR